MDARCGRGVSEYSYISRLQTSKAFDSEATPWPYGPFILKLQDIRNGMSIVVSRGLMELINQWNEEPLMKGRSERSAKLTVWSPYSDDNYALLVHVEAAHRMGFLTAISGSETQSVEQASSRDQANAPRPIVA